MNGNVKRMTGVPALLILASFIIVAAGMKAVVYILVLFFLAVSIAIMCTSPLLWLQRKGVPKVRALVLVLVTILTVGLLLGALIGPSPNHFSRFLSDQKERLSAHEAGCLEKAFIFYRKR